MGATRPRPRLVCCRPSRQCVGSLLFAVLMLYWAVVVRLRTFVEPPVRGPAPSSLWPPIDVVGVRPLSSAPECIVPVLGVPISPGMRDYTSRLVASIDSPLDTLVLVVNGDDDDTNAWVEGVTPGAHIRHVIKVFAPSNLGVAGATNRIMFETPDAAYWVISNNDIELAPGALREICLAALSVPASVGSLHPVMLSGIFPHRDHGWSIFVLLHHVVQRLGIWDENFYPAYAEDGDYETRLYGAGLQLGRLPEARVYHGPREVEAYTSGTERSKLERRHPFFDRVLAQVAHADREAYTADKFEAWAPGYNADAIVHWRFNHGIFGHKPLFGKDSTLFDGFWALDPVRRRCILATDAGSGGSSSCLFDRRFLVEGSGADAELLQTWNGADACGSFSQCLAKFRSAHSPLRVVRD